MKLVNILAFVGMTLPAFGKVFDRQPLSYAPIPEGTYRPAKRAGNFGSRRPTGKRLTLGSIWETKAY